MTRPTASLAYAGLGPKLHQAVGELVEAPGAGEISRVLSRGFLCRERGQPRDGNAKGAR
jgi:hypothetical protein